MCYSFLTMLTMLLSVTGTSLSDASTRVFDWSSTPYTAPGGRVFAPLIAEPGSLSIESEVRTWFGNRQLGETVGTSDGAVLGLDVKMKRRPAGVDALADLQAYEILGGAASLVRIGKAHERPIDGTLDVAGTAITNGTSLRRQLQPGARVRINGEVGFVESVDSDTTATLRAPHRGATGAEGTVEPLYTWAHPDVVFVGRVADRSVTNEDLSLRVEGSPFRSELVVAPYAGFGQAIDFRGAGAAQGATAWDPQGAFTATVRVWPFIEDYASTGVLVSNGDVEISLQANGVFRGEIETSTGTATLDAPGGLEAPAEDWTFITLRYDPGASPARLELLRGSEVVASTVPTGTLNSSGNPWVIGADETASAGHFTGLLHEIRLYGALLEDDEIAEAIAAPLQGEDTGAPLQRYWPGEAADVGGTDTLFETATVNLAAQDDATLTGWLRASSLDAPELESTVLARGIGPLEHMPANLVGVAGSPGASDEVYRVAQKLSQVTAVYELGESFDNGGIAGAPRIQHVEQTMKGFNDASLVSAGDVAVWPQRGAVKWNRTTSSLVHFDGLGEGPGLRSIDFDGVDGQVSFGTGANNLFTSSFTVDMWVLIRNKTDGQRIITNHDVSGTDASITVTFFNNALQQVRIAFAYTPVPPFPILITTDPLDDNVLYHFVWSVELDQVGQTFTTTVHQDGVIVDTLSSAWTNFSLTPSQNPLIVGGPTTGEVGIHFDGIIGELTMFSGALSNEKAREYAMLDKRGLPNLAHYYPAREKDYSSTTLTDVAGSVNGTFSGGVKWQGCLPLTNPLHQIDYYLRELSGVDWTDLDFSDAYSLWPKASSHVWVSQTDTADYSILINEAMLGVGGFSLWRRSQAIELSGTWSVSADSKTLNGVGGSALSELSNNSVVSIGGEHALVDRIPSNNEIRVASPHKSGATSVEVLASNYVLSFGQVGDPEALTPLSSISQFLELTTSYPDSLPEQVRVARRWIQDPGTETTQLVAPNLVRLWADRFRYSKVSNQRNADLYDAAPIFTIDSRLALPGPAKAEARRAMALFGKRRLTVHASTVEYAHPGELLAGKPYTVVSDEIQGGSGQFLILSSTWFPASERMSFVGFGKDIEA